MSESQSYQALEKLSPLEVSNSGNEVSEEQRFQAPEKLVPLEVSIDGNEVSEEQRLQVPVKLVTPEVSILLLKDVILEAPSQASNKVVPNRLPPVPETDAILVSDTELLKYGR